MLLKNILLLSISNAAITTAVIGVADVENAVKLIVYVIGGAILLFGVIDALSGYSNQSSGKMSEGIVKAIGGAGIIAIGVSIVSKIFEGITL